MPVAALPAIGMALGAAGSGASAAGGKKASNAANDLARSQLNLQQNQFDIAKQLFTSSQTAWQPAANYWNALLKGGQAAVQATGPVAQQIGQAYQGARTSIAANTPRGGEQNLALATSRAQQAGQIGNLYAGTQPLAASSLGQLAGINLGGASAFNPSANIGGAYQNYIAQQQSQQQAGQGFGGLLYNSAQKKRTGASGTSSGSGTGAGK